MVLPSASGLLGDLGCLLVADVPVERRHDRRRALGVLPGAIRVGGDARDASVREETADVGQQPDRLQDVARQHGQHDVQLEVAGRATEGDGGVVADDLGTDHAHRLGDHRVHLARHDRRARLQVGDVDLAQPGARTGAHPAQVVGDLEEADRHRPQLARCLDEAVLGALRLEVVARLGQRQAGALGQHRDGAVRETGRHVDAGADRGPAERQLRQPGQGGLQALDACPHLGGIAAELLAQRDRRGVHEVGSARLHHATRTRRASPPAPRPGAPARGGGR